MFGPQPAFPPTRGTLGSGPSVTCSQAMSPVSILGTCPRPCTSGSPLWGGGRSLDLAGTLVVRATDTDGHDGDDDDGNGIKMTIKVVTERQQLEFVGHGLESGCGPAPLCRGGGGPRDHTESWRVRARTGWGSCWGGASAPKLWTPFWGSFLSPGGWRDWDVSSAEVIGTFCDDTFRLSS